MKFSLLFPLLFSFLVVNGKEQRQHFFWQCLEVKPSTSDSPKQQAAKITVKNIKDISALIEKTFF